MKYLKNEEDAKDSVQQIYLKVIQELEKYKVDYFKSWLYMVAKNHCLMILRDRQSKIPAELTERHATVPAEENQREEMLQHDLALELTEQSIDELNPEQQQGVTLF